MVLKYFHTSKRSIAPNLVNDWIWMNVTCIKCGMSKVWMVLLNTKINPIFLFSGILHLVFFLRLSPNIIEKRCTGYRLTNYSIYNTASPPPPKPFTFSKHFWFYIELWIEIGKLKRTTFIPCEGNTEFWSPSIYICSLFSLLSFRRISNLLHFAIFILIKSFDCVHCSDLLYNNGAI